MCHSQLFFSSNVFSAPICLKFDMQTAKATGVQQHTQAWRATRLCVASISWLTKHSCAVYMQQQIHLLVILFTQTCAGDAYPIAEPDKQNLGSTDHIVVHRLLQPYVGHKQSSIQPCGCHNCDDVDVCQRREIAASRCLTALLELESRDTSFPLPIQTSARP